MAASRFLLEDLLAALGQDCSILVAWLKEKKVIRDFTDKRREKCNIGKLALIRDASKDSFVWQCNNRRCNKKISIRRESWFERSHLTNF